MTDRVIAQTGAISLGVFIVNMNLVEVLDGVWYAARTASCSMVEGAL